MHRSSHRRLLAFLLLCAIGCAPQRPNPDSAEPAADGKVLVVVENHHWNDVVVYLLHDGVADRIGLATAVRTSVFTVAGRRLGLAETVQLRADPVGAPDSFTSDAFTVHPGQEIQWTLESDLARSSVAVH